MSIGVLAIAACVPILVALVLMVWMHWPAVRAMPMAWAVCAVLAVVVWKMPVGFVLAATLGGFGNTLNILIIIFGAIVLLFSLQESGGMETIKQGIGGLSDDKRVQILLIAFLFSAFLEGAAGFGTPAAIAAPLLISLGFPALAAVMACLILNSFPVTFGVIGAVVWFGLKNLTPLVNSAAAQGIAPASIPDAWAFFGIVGKWAAVLNTLPIFILPLFVICFVTRYFGVNRSWREGLGAWKTSLFASACFAAAYLFFAFVMGMEFPSLMGGLIALAMTVFAVKKKWFLPAQTWTFGPKEQWEKDWIGSIDMNGDSQSGANMSQMRAWAPYILIGALLMLTRLSSLPFKAWVMGLEIRIPAILGYESVQFSMKPLYLPGIMPFMLTALLIVPMHGMSWKKEGVAWSNALKRITGPALALMFAVALVEIFKQSAHNALDYPSMPLAMAKGAAALAGGAWPLFASFVGALGAFITGSNTVSNLLFSEFQYGLAEQMHLPRQIIVALQLVGGSMGNMVCIHNIVAASAVVGLTGAEGAIIKRNFVPLLIYGLCTGLLGMLFCYVLFPGIF